MEEVFTFFNGDFLDPLKGLEGFLGHDIDIFSNIYNIGTLFGAPDWVPFTLSVRFFFQGE